MCAGTRQTKPWIGGCFIDRISAWLTAWGYRPVEVPSLLPASLFQSTLDGTENRMFTVDGGKLTLMPEATNYIRALGSQRLGTSKVFYVARCFRAETTTDATRLREFTQIGVELLGANPLDCNKVVRKDVLKLFRGLLPDATWELQDGVERGLNLYVGKTFEVREKGGESRQILGGGSYEGGAGWALGLERLQALLC